MFVSGSLHLEIFETFETYIMFAAQKLFHAITRTSASLMLSLSPALVELAEK